MFPQFKKINNESGIVLFIVLMTAIIIMIFSVGILTQSMNEINYAQQQIDQIACDQLSKGGFWNGYANGTAGFTNGATVTFVNGSTSSGPGRPYQVTIITGPSSGGISSYNVMCNYDTFN